jgi:hypothetical protein
VSGEPRQTHRALEAVTRRPRLRNGRLHADAVVHDLTD